MIQMANMQIITTLCIVEIIVEYFYSYQYIIDSPTNCVKQGVDNPEYVKAYF